MLKRQLQNVKSEHNKCKKNKNILRIKKWQFIYGTRDRKTETGMHRINNTYLMQQQQQQQQNIRLFYLNKSMPLERKKVQYLSS